MSKTNYYFYYNYLIIITTVLLGKVKNVKAEFLGHLPGVFLAILHLHSVPLLYFSTLFLPNFSIFDTLIFFRQLKDTPSGNTSILVYRLLVARPLTIF